MKETGESAVVSAARHPDGQVLHVRPTRPLHQASIAEEHLLETVETVTANSGPTETLLEVPLPADTSPSTPSYRVSDVPLDQGYAWVVVFGCFLMHVLNVGLIKSFGIIFMELRLVFVASSYDLSWIYALFLLFSTWFAPVASVLANAFSQRSTVILGGFFMALGISLSYFAQNIYHLYFTYGCLSVCVGSYFDKRRGLANGVSLSGAAVGSIAMPYLVTYLINKYSLFGAILICGGVAFNVSLAGAFLRPSTVHQKILHAQKRSAQIRALGYALAPTSQAVKAFSAPTSARSNGGVSGVYDREPETYSNLLETPSQDERKRSAHSMPDGPFRTVTRSASEQRRSFAKQLPIFQRFRNRFRRKEGQPPLFDFRLFRMRLFLVYATSVMLSTFAFMNVFLILPPHIGDLGFSKDTSASMIAVIGIADFFARIGFGYFSDLKLFHRKWGFCGAIYCASLCNFLLPLATDYVQLTAYAVFFGMTSGSYISLVAVVCVDFFGIQRLSSALGSVIAFQGFAFLIGPPLIGRIRDVTGSYRYGFYALGVCLIIAASLIILEHFLDLLLSKCKNGKSRRTGSEIDETNMVTLTVMPSVIPKRDPSIPPLAHMDEFDKLTPRPASKPIFQPKTRSRRQKEFPNNQEN